MHSPPQQPQQTQQPASDAASAAVAAGPSVPSKPGPGHHIGWGRIAVAVLLLAGAAVGCVFALWPTRFGVDAAAVSGPETALALSASAAVGALYFFLSAQVRRTQEETRRLTEDVEHRAEEAVSTLRREVETLHDAVARRTEERTSATEQAAQAVVDRPTPEAVVQLIKTAGDCGLTRGGEIQVSLKDEMRLSFQPVALTPGYDAPFSTHPQGQEPNLAVIVQEPVIDAEVALPGRSGQVRLGGGSGVTQLAATFVPLEADASLAEAFADLRDDLLGQQHAWKRFPDDADRALHHLATTVPALAAAIEEAEEPLQLGTIDVVLDDEHVLMSGPQHKTIVKLTDPITEVPLTRELATQAGEDPDGVLAHPMIARHLRALRSKPRFAGSADAGSRSPPTAY